MQHIFEAAILICATLGLSPGFAATACLSAPCIYVAAPHPRNGPTIAVYPLEANGNSRPVQMIRGRKTGLVFPVGIAVDDARTIYVADIRDNSIAVFAAGAAGNVAPARRIAGAHTGLNAPAGVALDRTGNIYVANQNDGLSGGSVTVYASNADGDSSPMQSISGPTRFSLLRQVLRSTSAATSTSSQAAQ